MELYPFRAQKFAIGQIAYNEDNSTAVMTPFPGRVTRLIAKIGDKVSRGDPLFEIDSPEVVQPQNDFIAALSVMNKVRSQLDLAQIVEKRFKDLYEGKAAALKEWQQAQAQLVSAQNDLLLCRLQSLEHHIDIVGQQQAPRCAGAVRLGSAPSPTSAARVRWRRSRAARRR